MRMQATVGVWALTAAAGATLGQSYNLDCGVGGGVPSATYGAAAAQPGFWNGLPGQKSIPVPLRDLTGAYQGATFETLQLPLGPLFNDELGIIGDEGALLNDSLYLSNRPRTLEIAGLVPGLYHVYVYAFSQEDPEVLTTISVNGSDGEAVGGEWSGDLLRGVTYALADVVLPFGSPLDVTGFSRISGKINGIQIVLDQRFLTIAPSGTLPLAVPSGGSSPVAFVIDPHDETVLGTPQLWYRFDAADEFTAIDLVNSSGTVWTASLPGGNCGQQIEYYVTASGSASGDTGYPIGFAAATLVADVGSITETDLLNESFESGLPSGWTATGLWHADANCAINGACDGAHAVGYNIDEQCNFDDGTINSGTLALPTIDLSTLPPNTRVWLLYCSQNESMSTLGPDTAEVHVNGKVVAPDPVSQYWHEQAIDITDAVSGSASIQFVFDSVEEFDNAFRGWFIDHVRVVARTNDCVSTCPCTADFDGSGGTPDASDIDAFFTAWLAGDLTSDADCSGGTPDSTDIDVFFSQWLAGGC